jgi:hypothetical protein
MLLTRKNLVNELLSERNKRASINSILDEVKSILDENQVERDTIENELVSKSSTIANTFLIDELDKNCIFQLEQIKTICIDYRLRFLDSHLFKGQIPAEAISKISALEKTHQTQLSGFKIMAPSKLFKLESYDDPLLFVPIGNNYYYLIHKWGNDLHPLRKWAMKPFKTMENFILLLAVISIFLAAILPLNILGKTTEGTMRLVSFLFILKSLVGFCIYYCFSQGKNFSENIWLSKYYN